MLVCCRGNISVSHRDGSMGLIAASQDERGSLPHPPSAPKLTYPTSPQAVMDASVLQTLIDDGRSLTYCRVSFSPSHSVRTRSRGGYSAHHNALRNALLYCSRKQSSPQKHCDYISCNTPITGGDTERPQETFSGPASPLIPHAQPGR